METDPNVNIFIKRFNFKKINNILISKQGQLCSVRSISEGTLRAYCSKVGVAYNDSMVHWRPLTQEQREVFSRIKGPNMLFFRAVLSSTEFKQHKPSEPNIEDINEKYRDIIEEAMPLYIKLRELKLEPVWRKNN